MMGLLSLFNQTQEKVKEAYSFQGPAFKNVAKSVLAPAILGAGGGGTVGGIKASLESGTPESAEVDILKGVGKGALLGASLGALGGGIANREAIKEYANYKPVRSLMDKAEEFKRIGRDIARQVTDEKNPAIKRELKDTAFHYANESNKARKKAVQLGVKLKEKTAEAEYDQSLFDRLTGRRKYHYLFGKRIGKEEAQNIEKVLREQQPRTEEERNIQNIVGARPTAGQVGRAATVGSVGGIGAHLLGSVIGGGEKWIPDFSSGAKSLLSNKDKAVLHPRSLLRSAAVGGVMTGALPITKRLWDIHTAREKPEAF